MPRRPSTKRTDPSAAAVTREGVLLVISGTGGAGKGTIVERLRQRFPDLWWSVSWATRPPRAGEIAGDHYWFHTDIEVLELRDAGGFLDWAEVYGVFKGTPLAPLVAALAAGHDALLEMDIQGARNVVARLPHARVMFVVAPSSQIQAERLRSRGTDTEADIQRRLDQAEAEEAEARAAGFDIVINQDIDLAVNDIAAILDDSRSGGRRS